MKPEEQRIALAEWAGEENPPDYLNDLNAVHELEKRLDQNQCHTYTEHLASSPQNGTWAGCCMWHISAAQRCEALLKTLNLWKGGEA